MTIATYRNKIDQYLETMPDRDRKALLLLSVFLGVVLFVYGLLLPVLDYRAQAKKQYLQEHALYQWLQNQQGAVAIAKKSNTQTTGEHLATRSSLSLVNSSAKAHQLVLKRIQPESNGSLRVWLENVNFNSALQWMHNLNQQGQIIIDLNIDRVASGQTNLRITIATNE